MRITTLLLLAITAGCASSSSITPVGTERPQSIYITDGTGGTLAIGTTVRTTIDEATFAVPVAEVWRVLPIVLDSLGVTVNELNSGTRLIGNSGMKLRRQLGGVRLSRYFDCGTTQGSHNADTYEVHVSLLTQAHQFGPDGTRLTISLQAQAKPISMSGEWLRCSVSGALQTRLVDLIDSHIRR